MALHTDDKYIQDIFTTKHPENHPGNQPYLHKQKTDHTWSVFIGGSGWIRTSSGLSQQIYSLPRLSNSGARPIFGAGSGKPNVQKHNELRY